MRRPSTTGRSCSPARAGRRRQLAWLAKRNATVVGVGGEVAGARTVVRYAGDDDPEVAAHTEVLVGELVAATWGEGDRGG